MHIPICSILKNIPKSKDICRQIHPMRKLTFYLLFHASRLRPASSQRICHKRHTDGTFAKPYPLRQQSRRYPFIHRCHHYGQHPLRFRAKTGIQTLVVAVTGIEGGDCFDFAHRLGQETGVGQKNVTMDWSSCFPPTNGVCNSLPDMALKGYCRMPSANGFRTAICCPISRTITGTPEW